MLENMFGGMDDIFEELQNVNIDIKDEEIEYKNDDLFLVKTIEEYMREGHIIKEKINKLRENYASSLEERLKNNNGYSQNNKITSQLLYLFREKQNIDSKLKNLFYAKDSITILQEVIIQSKNSDMSKIFYDILFPEIINIYRHKISNIENSKFFKNFKRDFLFFFEISVDNQFFFSNEMKKIDNTLLIPLREINEDEEFNLLKVGKIPLNIDNRTRELLELKQKFEGKFVYESDANVDVENSYLEIFTVEIDGVRVLNPYIVKLVKLLLPVIVNIIYEAKYIEDDKLANSLGFKNRFELIFKTNLEINEIRKIFAEKGLPSFYLAEILGDLILDNLSLEINKNISLANKNRFKMALGILILERLSTLNGIIKLKKNKINLLDKNWIFYGLEINRNEFSKILKVDFDENRLFKFTKEYTNVLNSLGSVRFNKSDPIPLGIKILPNIRIKNTIVNEVSDEVVKFIDKEQSIIYEANNIFDIVLSFQDKTKLKLANIKDEVHFEYKLDNESKKYHILESYALLEEFYLIIKNGFKTKWNVSDTLKLNVENKISPYSNDIHRGLTRIKGNIFSIPLKSNSPKLILFKKLFLQLFNFNLMQIEDEMGLEILERDYFKIPITLKEKKKGLKIKHSKLKIILNYIKDLLIGNELTLKEESEIIEFLEYKDKLRAFHGLVELARLDMQLQENPEIKFFETDLLIEFKPIDSDLTISLLQALPIVPDYEKDEIIKYLFKEGIFFKNTNLEFKDYREQKILKDSMKRMAKDSLYPGFLYSKGIKNIYIELAENLSITIKSKDYEKYYQELDFETNKLLINLFNYLENIFDEKLIKKLFTYYLYASKIMIKELYKFLIDKLYDDMKYFGDKGITLSDVIMFAIYNRNIKGLKQPKNWLKEISSKLDSFEKDKFNKFSQIFLDFIKVNFRNDKIIYDKELVATILDDDKSQDSFSKKIEELFFYNDLKYNTLKDISLNVISIKNTSKYFNYFYIIFEPIINKEFKKFEFLKLYMDDIRSMSKVIFNITFKIFIDRMKKIASRDIEISNPNNKEFWTLQMYEDVILSMIEDNIWYDIQSIFQDINLPLERRDESVIEENLIIHQKESIRKIAIKLKHFIDNEINIPYLTIKQIESKLIIDSVLENEDKVLFSEDLKLFIGVDTDFLQVVRRYNQSLFHSAIEYNIYIAFLERFGTIYRSVEGRNIIENGDYYKFSETFIDEITSLMSEDLEYVDIDLITNKIKQKIRDIEDIVRLKTILKEKLNISYFNKIRESIKKIYFNKDITFVNHYLVDDKRTIFKVNNLNKTDILSKHNKLFFDFNLDNINIDKHFELLEENRITKILINLINVTNIIKNEILEIDYNDKIIYALVGLFILRYEETPFNISQKHQVLYKFIRKIYIKALSLEDEMSRLSLSLLFKNIISNYSFDNSSISRVTKIIISFGYKDKDSVLNILVNKFNLNINLY